MDMFVNVCVSKNQIEYKSHVLLWSTIAFTAADYVLILILISHINHLGWSTCPLVFICWELSHVVFLKLRKKEQQLAKLRKFTK